MSSMNDPEVLRSILECLSIGLCVLDSEKKIVLWSNGAERITGHLRHEVIGRSCVPEPILHCDQPGYEFCSEECPLAQAMKTARRVDGRGLLYHKEGHEIPVRTRAAPVHNAHGSIIGAVETFEEFECAQNPDRRTGFADSEIDPVTSAAKRQTTEAHLAHAYANFRSSQVPFGVLLLRVEQLAYFRARFGSEAASSFLRLVARTLEGALGMAEIIGRWSDSEFLILLPGCGDESLPTIRERVRRTVASEGIEWWGERHSLPVSVGQASVQVDDTPETLVERARLSLNASSAWLSGRTSDQNSETAKSSGSQ